MNKKHLIYPLLVVSALLFSSCNENIEDSSSLPSGTTSEQITTSTPTSASTSSGSSSSTHYFDPTSDPYQVTEMEYNEIVKPQWYTHHLHELNCKIEIMFYQVTDAMYRDLDPDDSETYYLSHYDHGKVADSGRFLDYPDYNYQYYFYFGENYLHSTSENYLDDEHTYNFKNGDDVSVKTTKPQSDEDKDLLFEFFSFYDFREIPFENLTYNEESRSYRLQKLEIDGEATRRNIEIKFYEGRPTSFSMFYPGDNYHWQLKVSDYDTTVVNLPEGFPS